MNRGKGRHFGCLTNLKVLSSDMIGQKRIHLSIQPLWPMRQHGQNRQLVHQDDRAGLAREPLIKGLRHFQSIIL